MVVGEFPSQMASNTVHSVVARTEQAVERTVELRVIVRRCESHATPLCYTTGSYSQVSYIRRT